MKFVQADKIDLKICAACNGSGRHRARKCETCNGRPASLEFENKIYDFNYSVDEYQINLRNARRRLDAARIIAAIILASGLLVVFFLNVEQRKLWDYIFDYRLYVGKAGGFAALFWFAIVWLSYLFYRIVNKYKAKPLIGPAERPASQDDPDSRIDKHSKHIEIAQFFTPEALRALDIAYLGAKKRGAEQTTTLDLFLALIKLPQTEGMFLRLGVLTSAIEQKIKGIIADSVQTQTINSSFNQDIWEVIFAAFKKAALGGYGQVHAVEILHSVAEKDKKIQEILYEMGVEYQKMVNVIKWVRIGEKLREYYLRVRKAGTYRSKYGLDRAMTAVATPFLNRFSDDLTMMAKYGHLPVAVARDKEINDIFNLVTGGRQSVMLVGAPGVGKMSIIEGIAQKMIIDDVPKRLSDKRLVYVSTAKLLSGVNLSGAQQRLLNIMHEVGRAKNIILFINNIHDLVGVEGQGAGFDLSETLAEHLGPGRFLTFATTTVAGYNRQIAGTELAQVFGRVEIAQMNTDQAVQVLESKVGIEEHKHKIFFSYNALEQCVQLSQKLLHDQNLPESAISLMSETAAYVRNNKGENVLVTADDVAKVVSGKTGVPTASITEDEADKLIQLEEAMHERVIGQDEAVSLVSSALRRARTDVRSDKRPISVFLFLGPTGVGKTELAKTIADVYFGSEKSMIRIDMSEYQEQGSIYRLIGEPGKQGTGILTETVHNHPFSLILLDELEKAEKNVLNLFLQVFDDGRLTDSTGKTVDFTNTIIITTSNAGTAFVSREMAKGRKLEEIRQDLIRGELQNYYAPEFLNRFDGVVLFKSLNKKELKQIAVLMLKRVAKDLEERGVELKIEDSALEKLCQVGYDPQFGARPMRRAIQEIVENQLADLILKKQLKRGGTAVLGPDAKIRLE